MKKFIFAASAAVAAIAMAPAANAAVVDPIDLSSDVTDSFGGVVDGVGYFTDVFTFTLAQPSALTSASITNILVEFAGLGDIDFLDVWFNDDIYFDIFNDLGGTTDLAQISGVPLAAGTHTLTVYGYAYGRASYGGNITVSQAPIPEPTTWAMMLAGVAAVGMAMRRRTSTTAVSFS